MTYLHSLVHCGCCNHDPLLSGDSRRALIHVPTPPDTKWIDDLDARVGLPMNVEPKIRGIIER